MFFLKSPVSTPHSEYVCPQDLDGKGCARTTLGSKGASVRPGVLEMQLAAGRALLQPHAAQQLYDARWELISFADVFVKAQLRGVAGESSCRAGVTVTLCPGNSGWRTKAANLKPCSRNGPGLWSCPTSSVWGPNQTREDSAAKCPSSVGETPS